MVSIENADYYGMEEFLSDSNLGLLTNDWPGNDPVSFFVIVNDFCRFI